MDKNYIIEGITNTLKTKKRRYVRGAAKRLPLGNFMLAANGSQLCAVPILKYKT